VYLAHSSTHYHQLDAITSVDIVEHSIINYHCTSSLETIELKHSRLPPLQLKSSSSSSSSSGRSNRDEHHSLQSITIIERRRNGPELINLIHDLHHQALQVTIVEDLQWETNAEPLFDMKTIPACIQWIKLITTITAAQLQLITHEIIDLSSIDQGVFSSYDVLGNLLKSLQLLTYLDVSQCGTAGIDDPTPSVMLGLLAFPLKNDEMIEMKALKDMQLYGGSQSLVSTLIVPTMTSLVIFVDTDDNEAAPIDMSHILMQASLLQQLILHSLPFTLESLKSSLSLPSLTDVSITYIHHIPSTIKLLTSCPILIELELAWTNDILRALHSSGTGGED
jgi:hypothetical protein